MAAAWKTEFFCIRNFSKAKSKPAGKIQGDVFLFNAKPHANIQALLKKKRKNSKSSLRMLLHSALQLYTCINLLLTEREGRAGEYWPEVVAVRTSLRSVRTKTTEGQYSPVRFEQARLVSSLLYGTRVMLVSKLPAFENKKYTSYDHFRGNGPYGKIPTKKEPIRTPGLTPRLPCHIIM